MRVLQFKVIYLTLLLRIHVCQFVVMVTVTLHLKAYLKVRWMSKLNGLIVIRWLDRYNSLLFMTRERQISSVLYRFSYQTGNNCVQCRLFVSFISMNPKMEQVFLDSFYLSDNWCRQEFLLPCIELYCCWRTREWIAVHKSFLRDRDKTKHLQTSRIYTIFLSCEKHAITMKKFLSTTKWS